MSELTRFPLCWPNNVPRRPPHLRGRPAFQERSVSTASPAAIVEAYRRLAKRFHPDAAGESAEAREKWLQISNAHD